MADRVVKVSLTAQVSNYVAGMEQARQATAKASKESVDAKAKFAEQNQAMTEVGQGLIAVGALAAVGVAIAVKKFADFDEAISNVKAATQETAENMGLLREAALDAGARTVFSATEAANAIEELGKAGLSTADILNGGLDGALDLAAAGGLGVAEAAGIAAVALKTFGLRGTDMSHVADLLAAGAGKAMGDVTDLSSALAQAGQVAASTGISIEETTAVLAAFASKGLMGSDAGTSFKAMLQRLTPQSKEAERAMDDLGISAYDAGGEFIGMSKFAGVLQKALKDKTTEERNSAMATIFGSDAVRAANVLYAEGEKGIAKWTDEVNDSGYAAKVAADRLDNLKGDVEKLGGAFDTALIRSGSAANDVLRGLVQGATFLVDAIGALPAPVLGAGLAVTAIAGALALSGGAALVAVPKIAQYKMALDTLNISAKSAGLAVGIAGGVLALAAVGISVWVSENAKAAAKTDAYADTLEKATSRITNATRAMAKENLAAKQSWWFIESDSTYDAAEKLGISLDLVTEAATGNVDALEKLNDELVIGTAGSDRLKKMMDETGMTASDLAAAVGAVEYGVRGESESMVEAIRIAKQKQSADQDAAGAATEHEAALAALEGKAEDTSDAVEDLADTIRNFGSATLDVREANRNLEEAYDDLTASIAENGRTLDIAGDAGRANQSALDGIAEAAKEAAAATYVQTGSQEQATAVLEAGRVKLIEMLGQFGITGAAADAYADELGLIPGNINTAVSIDTAAATTNLDNWIRNVNGRKVEIVPVVGGRPFNKGEYYDGGFTGHGGKYEPAGVVHRGEFVSTKETTANPANRAALEYMHRGGVIRGFANGGPVGAIQYAPPSYASTGGSAGASFQVVVSQKGGVDLLKYVDVAIVQADQSSSLTSRNGRQVR